LENQIKKISWKRGLRRTFAWVLSVSMMLMLLPVMGLVALADPGDAKIRGEIHSSDTSAGLDDALVELFDGSGPTGKDDTTTGGGFFEINSLDAGEYYIVVSEAGHYTSIWYITLEESEDSNEVYELLLIGSDAPAVDNPSIDDDTKGFLVGNTLTAIYDEFLPGDAIGGTDESIFQWYRVDEDNFSHGSKTLIVGADSETYEPNGLDIGKYLFVEITPIAETTDHGFVLGDPEQISSGVVVGLEITLDVDVACGADCEAILVYNEGDVSEITLNLKDSSDSVVLLDITDTIDISADLCELEHTVSWSLDPDNEDKSGAFSDDTSDDPGYSLPADWSKVVESIKIIATFDDGAGGGGGGPTPAIVVSTTSGLDDLTVGVTVTGLITFTLTNGEYESPLPGSTAGDDFKGLFELPDGLTFGAVNRTGDTTVTVAIGGIPTTRATTTITSFDDIPKENVDGATADITPTGSVVIEVANKGTQSPFAITPPGPKFFLNPDFQLYVSEGGGVGNVFYVPDGAGPQAGNVSNDGLINITGAGTITVIATKVECANWNQVVSAPLPITVSPATIPSSFVTAISVEVPITAEQDIEVILPSLPTGALYPTSVSPSGGVPGLIDGGSADITEGVLKFDTTAQSDTTTTDFVIAITWGANYTGPSPVTVTVTASAAPKETTPIASIDFIGERLAELVAGASYIINGGPAVPALAGGFIPINASWINSTITIVKVGAQNSDAQSLIIPNRPGAPTTVAPEHVIGVNNQGAITNTTSFMQYRGQEYNPILQDFEWSDWYPITGTSVNLWPGTYEVRTSSTFASFVSSAHEVIILLQYGIYVDDDGNPYSNIFNFGSIQQNAPIPNAQTVWVMNVGENAVTLIQPTSLYYEIEDIDGVVVAPRSNYPFTIQPNASTAATVQNYDETIIVSVKNGGSVVLSEQIIMKFEVTASGGGVGGGGFPPPADPGVPPINDATDFVKGLFQFILGRDSDPEGLEYWLNELLSGNVPGRRIGVEFVNSTEFKGMMATLSPEDLITTLYRGLLGREPDPVGFAYWVGEVNRGVSLAGIARSFAEAGEFQALLASLGIAW